MREDGSAEPGYALAIEPRGLRVVATMLWGLGVALSIVLFLRFLAPYYTYILSTATALADQHAFIQFGLSPRAIATFVTIRDTIVVAVSVVVAMTILRRGMNNPLVLFVSLTLVVTGVMTPRVLDAPIDGGAWTILGSSVRHLGQTLFIVFLYVFPDGRFRPRWTRIAVVVWCIFTAASFVVDEVLTIPFEGLIWVQLAAQLVWLSGGVAVQVWRFRRVSDPTERQQTKWVVWGFAALVVGVVGVHVSRVALFARYGQDLGLAYYDLAAITVFGAIPMIIFPITIAVSILRNRLWDLETYLNRGLLYATLIVLLGLAFFGVLAVFQKGIHAVIGQESDLAVLATALIIATLAQPLGRRLKRLIDHTFYRSRVDAEAAVAEIGREMRTMVDLPALLDELLRRTTELFYVRHGAVYLHDGEGKLRAVAVTGEPEASTVDQASLDGLWLDRLQVTEAPMITPPGHDFELLVPLMAWRASGQELIGVLALGPRETGKGFSRAELSLLSGLAREAGTAVHVASLSRAFSESEERYRRLVDSSPDAIVLTDVADGRIQICSEQAIELFGASDHEQLLGRTLISFVPREERQRAIDLGFKLLEEGSIRAVTYTMLRFDGTPVYLELSGSLFYSEGGQPTGFVAVLRDISERKRAEDEIRQLNEELEQRVRDRTRQLEVANRELEAFSYSVSHDLRAPLRAINGFGRILVEDCGDALDDSGHDAVRRICRASGRMGELIDDLLEMSRTTRHEMALENVNLSDIAGQIAAELHVSAPERAVDFVIEDGVAAIGDDHLLRVVLENLIGNAWKFTLDTQSPQIAFGTTVVDGTTAYSVRDNGVGFEMEYVDKAFEPFQRLHPDRDFPGTGIGLATVQRIVSRHGGEIWAESTVGKGSAFFFTLDLDPTKPGCRELDLPASAPER